MAYKNGYLINLIIDNKLNNIEHNNNFFETKIENEKKYIIKLTNLNDKIVDAYLKIDGKKMGAYRIIPNETIDIVRPFRRAKDLYFLHKKKEYSDAKLFKNNNKNLGEIEVEFFSGELFPKDEEVDDYEYILNKVVYRLSDYEYNPKYMNVYKRQKCKEIIKDQLTGIMIPSEHEEVYSPIGLDDCEPEPDSESQICLNSNPVIEDEEPPPPYTPQINLPPNQADLGFTTYGDKSDLKYKMYQALNYNGNSTKIKIYLLSKITFEALR